LKQEINVKRILKMIKWILLGLLVLMIILVIIWFFISSGKIRTYTEPNSLSEKFVMDINGAPNGFFINSKNIDNPVLLLVSSGPGTDDYVFTDKYGDMQLEDEYTVVYWDYRWMGIAYDSDADADSITLDNLLDDTYKVTEYLKERFRKEKIYIMGFSGGSHIALREVERHPENYYAYIGMAQAVTDSYERDALMYNFMKKVFTDRDDSGLDRARRLNQPGVQRDERSRSGVVAHGHISHDKSLFLGEPARDECSAGDISRREKSRSADRGEHGVDDQVIRVSAYDIRAAADAHQDGAGGAGTDLVVDLTGDDISDHRENTGDAVCLKDIGGRTADVCRSSGRQHVGAVVDQSDV
jgi:pimeloyl-ACP methyl ester carboxylesterase